MIFVHATGSISTKIRRQDSKHGRSRARWALAAGAVGKSRASNYFKKFLAAVELNRIPTVSEEKSSILHPIPHAFSRVNSWNDHGSFANSSGYKAQIYFSHSI